MQEVGLVFFFIIEQNKTLLFHTAFLCNTSALKSVFSGLGAFREFIFLFANYVYNSSLIELNFCRKRSGLIPVLHIFA